MQKFWFSLLAVLTMSTPVLPQSVNATLGDSTIFRDLEIFLDTIEREELYFYPIELLLMKSNINNNITHLMVYARIFDFLLMNNLDLGYNPAENQLAIYSYSIPEELITQDLKNEMAEMEQKIIKDRLLFGFLKIKERYEYGIKRKFYKNTEDELKLQADVDLVINYGRFAYPTTVKNILLMKYQKLNREKIWKDMEKRN
jgi:Zn-dependent M28 family amino/carboxypeptidase